MTLSDRARTIGREINDCAGATLTSALRTGIAEFIGWPFEVSSGIIRDHTGKATAAFGCVIQAGRITDRTDGLIPANNTAVAIDVLEELGIEELRASFQRLADVKRLKKSSPPDLGKTPVATVTMTIIFAQRVSLPLEKLAEELQHLNERYPDREWLDMIAVSDVGVISYACQIPGKGGLGDIFPSDPDALQRYVPAFYVITTMRPTEDGTFNKMISFIAGYTSVFSPGAKVPTFNQLVEGVSNNIVTLGGYQYNLAGELKPVPREFYKDRYLPPLPMRIEARQGELLATVEFVPWQDGGIVLMRGKMPMEMILVYAGEQALKKAGLLRPSPDLQISYVLPIVRQNFAEMLARFNMQSNMVVKPTEPNLTIQKLDEGTSTPFIARIFMGLTRLRDVIYPKPKEQFEYDEVLDQTYSALTSARSVAKEIEDLWESHSRRAAFGEIARIRGNTIHVDEEVYRDLRRKFESFVYSAARTLKEGMRSFGERMGKQIGFLFQKQTSFDRGLIVLQATDPPLACYLRSTRAEWSERLIETRNNIDHGGWSLPRVEYSNLNGSVQAKQPHIDGQTLTEFVTFMLDRLTCFVEDYTAHCLQSRMPNGVTITEIPILERVTEAPERFRLTLERGGLTKWTIKYRAGHFQDV